MSFLPIPIVRSTLRRLQKGSFLLWALILGGLMLHLATWWLGKAVFTEWRNQNTYLHTTLEVTGSGLAVLIALWILLLHRSQQGPAYSLRISGALLIMGLLDGFHAICPPGQTFVWLHSIATCLGGMAFATIWLPTGWFQLERNRWPLALFVLATVVGFVSLSNPSWIPTMVDGGSFSTTAQLLNLSGGLLLLTAAVRFFLTWRASKNTEDLLFFLHTTFFGLAAIMFEQSELWDFAWWSWHLLRLLAYLVAFLFVFRSQFLVLERLTQSHQELNTHHYILNQRNQELQELHFLVSHDLKEPLRNQQSLIELFWAEEGDRISPQREQYLHLLGKAVNRMQELVLGMLDYAQLGKNPSVSEVPMSELVEAVKEDLALVIEENGATVEAPPLPTIQGYAVELRLLIQNLLGNALKFRKRHEPPRIRVKAEEIPEGWHFMVSDNGIGIPDDQLDKIFKMFKRLHHRAAFSGSGIGLAHCQKIVHLHGGRLWVTSQEGVGSTFHFTLPVTPAKG